jgi:hypothetical protein
VQLANSEWDFAWQILWRVLQRAGTGGSLLVGTMPFKVYCGRLRAEVGAMVGVSLAIPGFELDENR